jgi:uncharacterized protein HemX
MRRNIGLLVFCAFPAVVYAGSIAGAAAALDGFMQGQKEAEDREFLRQQRQFQLEMQRHELERQQSEKRERQQREYQQELQSHIETAVFKSSTLQGTIIQCHYETLTGYAFSINSPAACPATVRIDPISMQVWR